MSSSSRPTSPKGGSSSIQVAVRLRPMNDKEKKHDTLPVVTASTTEKTVTVIKGNGARQVRSQFHFDRVFTSFSTQEEVFEETLKPVIGDVLNGYESTVFAYGQTGTGKTHTMEGDLSSPDMHGVIPRSAQAIFEALKQAKYSDHSVTVSYLEIYNEDLCDLLSDEKQPVGEKRSAHGVTKLEIMEGKNGTFCRGLSSKKVEVAEDVLALMQKAQQQRKIGETRMNKASSRSHSIFTMNIKAKVMLLNDGSMMEFVGKLHMVDLAGSECAKTASLGKAMGAEASRERERMNINRSLLTLGRVISMLKEQSQSKKSNHFRIPYRDSKLTRILQESLGGRCKTVIIATLSPSVTAIEESTSTLNYAQSANGIINKPVSTSYMSVASGSSNQSASLSSESCNNEQGNSVEHWHQMECKLQYLQAQVEEAQAALARKHMQQQDLVEKAEKAECERREIEKSYYDASMRNNALKEELSIEVDKRCVLESRFRESKIVLKKTSAILCATQKTEATLTAEAALLLKTLKESISEGDKLHVTISEQQKVEIERRVATRNFHGASIAVLKETADSLATLSKESENYWGLISKAAKEGHENDCSSLTSTGNLLKNIAENVQRLSSVLKKQVLDDGGIVPSLKATSSSVELGINDLLKVVSDSEEALLSSCRSAHKQLEEYAGHLKKLAKTHSTISKESISILDNNISMSKDRMKKIIDVAVSSLNKAKSERVNRMASHSSTIAQWRAMSADATMEIKDTANRQSETLSEDIQMFSSQLHHHETLENVIAGQQSFIEKKGVEHIGYTSTQKSALLEQAEMLLMAQKKQQQLRQDVVQNIMSGVKDLVTKQILETLAHEEEMHIESLSRSNSGMTETNVLLQQSAKQITDTVQKSNSTMNEESQLIHQNDVQIRGTMENVKRILGDIAVVSNEHQVSASDFAARADESMSQIASLDKESQAKLETVKKEAEVCSSHTAGTVLKQTKDGILRLTRSGLEVASYSVGAVIPKSTAALDALEEPRKEFIESISNCTRQIRESLSSGHRIVESVAQKQCETAATLCNEVEFEESKFRSETTVTRQEEIDAQKESFLKPVAEHGEKTKAHLSACTSTTKKIHEQIDEVTNNIIRVEEEVACLPARNALSYSEHFTSTPSEENIIQEIDLGVVDKLPIEMSTGSVVEDNASNDESDRISRLSDGASVKSSGSVGTTVSLPVTQEENNDPQVLAPSSRSVSSATKSVSSMSRITSSANKPRRPLRVRVSGTPSGRNRKKARITGTPQRSAIKNKIRKI